MAIKATFSPTAHLLTEFGDSLDDTITTSRNAAGQLLVNGGAVPIAGGSATVANTSVIQVFGLGGNDTITLDESNGALPAAHLFGGAGNDTITGGSGADLLFGEAGNDILLGKGGDDQLFGGAGNDILTGGTGNDMVFGEGGNDRMIWNPGEGSDILEGGAGNDTAEVNGGNGAETFTITANGTRVRFDRVSPAPFSLDIGTTENLVLNANGGDDVIIAGNGLSSLISLTLDGGAGNDTITGGDGKDMLLGGDGNDTIIGGRGDDTALLGANDDTFIWNPGDGNDIVEGQDGNDTLLFNGANINEKIDIQANGGRVRFTRDVANITMDVNGVETIHFNALGGADSITVGDLSTTAVKAVQIDLAATPGSATGDGQADSVTVTGTAASDSIQVVGQGTSVTVAGLADAVQITGIEAANDSLTVKGGGGNDLIRADALPAGVLSQLTLDGGAGDDTLIGSQGADTLIGGDGNDLILGKQGNDTALMGAGGDTFQWDPGDGSDSVDGQDGFDALIFNGANVNENVDIAANGGHVRFFRDIANITMDLNSVERIDFNAFGGADNVTVGDLTGTGVGQVNIGLGASPGSTNGDGLVDNVTVNATGNADSITVRSSANGVSVNGLAADVNLFFPEATDRLTINGGNGDDTIDAGALGADKITLALNGGAGNDKIIGSAGNDLVNGGTGNDVAQLGAGDDVFVWNPGDSSDIVEGQDGNDTLVFNGANINENIDVSANGSRVRLTRDVGNVTMDVNGTETLGISASGGTDTITVNDLSGTDVGKVNVDLAAAGTVNGDGAVDTIVINATDGDDVITVTNDNGVVTVSGVGADIVISHFDANDRLVINGRGGDDVIEATGLTGMLLTADGGDGDDVLIGSPGSDILRGGNGDDVLIGNGGQDALDGGPGDNTVIASFAGPQSQASASLLGQFMASSFVPPGFGQTGAAITEQASTQHPLLAQPHT